jgi:uncharacterized phage protein gp47/JayE
LRHEVQRHISIKQFRYFIAVTETASVAGAARMINIAQSAIGSLNTIAVRVEGIEATKTGRRMACNRCVDRCTALRRRFLDRSQAAPAALAAGFTLTSRS